MCIRDRLETVLKNGEVQTVAYDYSASGDLVVAYSSYSNATQNTVARILSLIHISLAMAICHGHASGSLLGRLGNLR